MNWRTLAVVLCVAVVFVAGIARCDEAIQLKGSGDDSASIQTALDSAAAKGGVVKLGAGRFRLDKPISVPEGVTLQGVWEAPHHAQLNHGTVIEVYAGKNDESARPAVQLNPSSAVKGVTFFYPEQRIPDVVKYPYTVSGRGMHCSVIDCTFVNPYKAMDFGTSGNELHYISNVYGCPLKIGIHIDKCSDIGRIENVHFNPHYWFRTDESYRPSSDALIKFIGDNLTGFEFARTDWEYVLNTFVFGANIGYRFYADKDGSVNGNFLGIGADWCERAVVVEDCQEPGLLITNGEFVGREGAKVFMDIRPTNTGVVQLSNCSFWGPCPTIAQIDGKGSASLNQCNFMNQGRGRGAWTVEAQGGDLTIQGCRFSIDRPDIKLGKGVKAAVISGNRFQKSKEIENQSQGDVAEGLNVVVK